MYSVRDGNWKSFNDSTVTEYREEEVRQRRQTTGYIFFYMHKYVRAHCYPLPEIDQL